MTTTTTTLTTRETDISHFFQVNIALTGTAYTEVGYFVAVEGLSRRMESFVYKEGGRAVPHQLMTPAPFGELVLRWGHMERSTLWDWMAAVQVGMGFRRNVQIIHYMRDQTTAVRTIALTRAWPVEWRGANLSGEETRVAVEQLSLLYDDLTMTVTA